MIPLGELCSRVRGVLTSHTELVVSGAASIGRARETEITFANSEKHFKQFLASEAAAAVIASTLHQKLLADSERLNLAKPCIVVDDIDLAFTSIVEIFQPPVERTSIGISPLAVVSPSATIGENVSIYPGAVIMDNVEIGDDCTIFPNVTILENCRIGDRVQIFPNATLYENTIVGHRAIIHAGAVIGAYGFGYKSGSDGHRLSAQLGNVTIGDDVEIGANSTIDRGTYDSTQIGSGTKLDNLVMIGHNCQIGERNLLCSQVGIAGSCTTGDNVVMGGQVGLADHLTIGPGVTIGAKSGLMHDVDAGERYFGIPARPAREEMKIVASRAKLPEMRKQLKAINKQLSRLAYSANDHSVSPTSADDQAENQAA